MNIRSLIMVCLYILISNMCQAQNGNSFPKFIPPSPDAISFARYGEIPINHSTGVPKIEIPIYSLKCGSLQVPVTLSYHASGIKIRDMSSYVGLGWVLNAGGIISRTILGEPDELLQKPSYRTSQFFEEAPRASYSDKINLISKLQKLENNTFDVQSDRYTYNFNGHAGTFISDFLDDEIKTVPYSPIKIIKHNPNSLDLSYYDIISEDGTIYTFASREYSTSSGQSGGITSWYLTKISSPNMTDKINFYYSNSDTVCSNFNIQTYTKGLEYNNPDSNSPSNAVEYHPTQVTTEHKTLRLDSIISRNASIYFNYMLDRSDGRRTRLDHITIKEDLSRSILMQVRCFQGYFGTEEDTKRMKLDSIQIIGRGFSPTQTYSFHYINANLEVPTYWHPQTMGIYTSFSEDYWGYYNMSQSPTMIPKDIVDLYDPTIPVNYTGNRNPRPDAMKTFTLDEIKYPTGGKTIFEYECNNVGNRSFYGYPNSNNGNIGGLRIKKILNYKNDQAVPIIKTYEYDINNAMFNGITGNIYAYTTDNFYFAKGYAYEGYHVLEELGYTNRNVYSSTTTIPSTLQNESPIYYGSVTEYLGTPSNNKGKTIYKYNFSYNSINDYIAYSINDLRYASLYHVDRGEPQISLIEKTEYKNIGGSYKKVHEVDHSYHFYKDSSFITGIRVNNTLNLFNIADYPTGDPWLHIDNYLGRFIYENTIAYTEIALLTKADEYFYDSEESKFLENSVTYAYDLNTLQIISKSSIDSKGDTLKTIMKHPNNFPSQDPYSTMLERNMLTPIIKQTKYKNTLFIDSLKTNYRLWSGHIIAPEYVKRTNGNNPTEVLLQFNKYDDKGNVVNFSKGNNLKVNYIWDYAKVLPIAKADNATDSDVAYTSFEADGKGNWSFSGTPVSVSSAITGTQAYSLGSGSVSKYGLSSSKNYIVSYWLKSGGSASISGSTPSGSTTGKTINGWVYHEVTVTGTTSVNLSGNGYIDEIRLYPSDAQMTTYTYDPLIGMTSKCDVNNNITYYEYDDFGRLSLIRDEDDHILKEICYNYAGEPGNCSITVYYNTPKSGSFTRNNCINGGSGSTVTYMVPAGTYTSTISQADADQKAQNDVNNNGQSYANSHGHCTWWNVEKSGTFTRNNCTSGTGSAVVYTVPSHTYSSTISQMDANQKAQNDVNTNGQPYANVHGACMNEPIQVYARLKSYFSSYRDSTSHSNQYGGIIYDYYQLIGIYIYFYSDAACTQPYTLTHDVDFTIKDDYFVETESGYDYSHLIAYQGTAEAGTNMVFVDDVFSFESFIGSTDSNGDWIFYEQASDYYDLEIGGGMIVAPSIHPDHSTGY